MPVRGQLDEWKRLLAPESAALRAAAAAVEHVTPNTIAMLRDHGDPSLVPLALELGTARRKAARKFPDKADELVADVHGIEQASGAAVGAWKARRFQDAAPTAIFDLCCGIGGDAMALAPVAPVTAIDVDPIRAWMCACNATCTTSAIDVTTVPMPEDAFVHIDPARRDESTGRRIFDLDAMAPSLSEVRALTTTSAGVAIKLGPGAPLDLLDDPASEVEVISDEGGLVQAVVWSGALARSPGRRTATVLPHSMSFTSSPAPLDHRPPSGPCLMVPHAALERTRLVAPYLRANAPHADVADLAPGLGVLRGDAIDDPLLEAFDIVEVLPWRTERVRDALRALDAGPIVVRTRGKAVDPDRVALDLRGDGSTEFAVFVLRSGERVDAFITSRRTSG